MQFLLRQLLNHCSRIAIAQHVVYRSQSITKIKAKEHVLKSQNSIPVNFFTHIMNSAANNKLTSSVGMSMTFSTTISRINDALGTLTELIDTTVAVSTTAQRSPVDNSIPFNRAIKYVAMVMNMADALVFMWQPIGRTNCVILRSTRTSSSIPSILSKVKGKVAAVEQVANAEHAGAKRWR